MGQNLSLACVGCCADRHAHVEGSTLSGQTGGNGGNRLVKKMEEEEAELDAQAKRQALAT